MKCCAEDQTWGPHPGCAEFMDGPEVWDCDDEAICTISYIDHMERDDAHIEALCPRHRQEFLRNMPSWVTVVAITSLAS